MALNKICFDVTDGTDRSSILFVMLAFKKSQQNKPLNETSSDMIVNGKNENGIIAVMNIVRLRSPEPQGF